VGKIFERNRAVIKFKICSFPLSIFCEKGFEGFYKVYLSLEPKERQALARLFMKRDVEKIYPKEGGRDLRQN